MKQDALNKQIWLIETILQQDGITLKEIKEKWLKSYLNDEQKDFDRSTFNRYRNTIEDIFGISIICQNSKYYIDNKEDIQNNILKKWILNSFTISNFLQEWKSLYHRISLEDIPSGREYLRDIMEAMKQNEQISISYQRFQNDVTKHYVLAPYGMKIFKQRWYVVGLCSELKDIRIFGLDRILELQRTTEKFKFPTDFNLELFFSSSFGVFTDKQIERVVLKTNEEKTKYLQSLPLHHSQKEIKTEDNYTFFEYFLRPTYDFRQEILSHGAEIEVISPNWFRKEIQQIVAEMHKFYS
ncbi:helix-turn-helix transcriptional regulator [Capnocytophaga canimorsus]|uniref:helix-turn-helix transcriptional regulator n=1 Tax=Capnocytophaga canimorsus TaxID=28188 RepID=UPI001AC36933|nr:WYL domain-containing protein [Capnocytophaga canimorsus]GIM59754.1 WYL domain-containing protein [Capnocytophaga canimorsus]